MISVLYPTERVLYVICPGLVFGPTPPEKDSLCGIGDSLYLTGWTLSMTINAVCTVLVAYRAW